MKKPYLIAWTTLVMAVTIIVYLNHFNNAFQFDDAHVVEENAYIRDLKNLPLFFTDGTTFTSLPLNQTYRPLVTASLAIDYKLGKGYNLFYFHLSTFILFLLQGVLMVFFFNKILKFTSAKSSVAYASIVAAALYLLHPAIAETVNYVSARSDVQSTLFVLLGFILYMYSSFCKKYFLYLLPVCIGGLAKPTVVMFAPMLFFYILFFDEQLNLYQIFKKAFLKQTMSAVKKSLPAFITCIALYMFIDKMTPATWVPGGTSVTKYVITQPFVIVHYFGTFFIPNNLSADSDWKVLETIFDFRFFIGILFIVLMVYIALQTSKKQLLRPVSFGIIWFFLALVPSSSIVPLGEVLNDHRMFFPFIGLALSVVWSVALLVYKIAETRKDFKAYRFPLALVLLIILSAYAYGTVQRNKVWNTPESLWHDVTVKSPENGRGLMNYGNALMKKGDYAGAMAYFSRSLQIWPNYSYAYINIGIAKSKTGDIAGAEASFKTAIQLNNQIPDAYAFYARYLIEAGKNTEAKTILENGLAISPQHGNLLQLKQQNEIALPGKINTTDTTIDELVNIAAQTPTPENYLSLSLVYYNNGAFKKCIKAAEEALKLKPDYDLAYNNICAAYNRLQQWDKAIATGEKGLQINPNNELLKNNVAESKLNKARAQ